jgi:hypothetical protein
MKTQAQHQYKFHFCARSLTKRKHLLHTFQQMSHAFLHSKSRFGLAINY